MRKGWIIALAIFLLIIGVALGISVYNKNKTDNTNIVDNKKLAEENEINNVVPTAVVEEKVSPNAKVIQKQYFTGCDHLLKETKDIPENLVNKNKEEVDRAVKDGDVVDIKYVGKKDGVEFDGGSSDSYELTIGSNTFIDGFEDGVIGMKKDETKELNLTFPEDYSNTDLAGADVVFTVTVNHVYEETDAVLDDAFVAARNIDGVSTVAEYRQYVYDNLMSSAKSQQETELERNVLEAVTANATFKETPEEMVSRYYDRLVKNLTATASMYGIDLETFMSYSYGLAADEYEDELQKSAQSAAEQIMVMQAIAEKEGLTLTDEELQADLESSASEYGYDSVDAYQEAIGDLRGYKEYLMSEKVTKYLIENANVTETEASTEEATEETTETETETTTETATEAE